MAAHFSMRTHWVNQAFRIVEGIWLHRTFFEKGPVLHHTGAKYSELPSYTWINFATQFIVINSISRILFRLWIRISKQSGSYCMSKKSWPISYCNLLYELDQNFFDIQLLLKKSGSDIKNTIKFTLVKKYSNKSSIWRGFGSECLDKIRFS